MSKEDVPPDGATDKPGSAPMSPDQRAKFRAIWAGDEDVIREALTAKAEADVPAEEPVPELPAITETERDQLAGLYGADLTDPEQVKALLDLLRCETWDDHGAPSAADIREAQLLVRMAFAAVGAGNLEPVWKTIRGARRALSESSSWVHIDRLGFVEVIGEHWRRYMTTRSLMGRVAILRTGTRKAVERWPQKFTVSQARAALAAELRVAGLDITVIGLASRLARRLRVFGANGGASGNYEGLFRHPYITKHRRELDLRSARETAKDLKASWLLEKKVGRESLVITAACRPRRPQRLGRSAPRKWIGPCP